jgi:hypothetical protein
VLPNLNENLAAQRIPNFKRHPLMMKHNPTMIIGPRDEELREKDPRDAHPRDEVTAIRKAPSLKENPAMQRVPHPQGNSQMINNPTMSIDLRDEDPRDVEPRDEETIMREISCLKGNPVNQRVPHQGDPLTMNDLTMITTRKIKGNVPPQPRRLMKTEGRPEGSARLLLLSEEARRKSQ